MTINKCSNHTILVIGLGLIGGSFAKALKASGEDYTLIGYDQHAKVIDEAASSGAIDYGADSLEQAVAAAQVILLSVPMLGMKPVLELLAQWDLTEKVITDAGSCKSSFVNAAQQVFGNIPANIVPGHPLAGSERSGIKAANASLFVAHNVLLTPLPVTSKAALIKVKCLWEQCGAKVSYLSVDYHDKVLALTSHLPHFIAFSLVNTLVNNTNNQTIFHYAAGGFRDTTRIAESNPTMWHDIALENKTAVLHGLDQFLQTLGVLRQAIEQDDSQQLLALFERAQCARAQFSTLSARREYMKRSHNHLQTFLAKPSHPLMGTVRVPGDKSISHRAIMLGALAEGTTVIEGFLEGEDALATLQAFKKMGVAIEGPDHGKVIIHGVGMNGLKKPAEPLYLGNAGTAMRLMAGLMAAQSFDTTLTGDESLSSRPMNRIIEPLTAMGAAISTNEQGTSPLQIKGGATLTGCHYTMPIASAQVQSCLLLAGMYAEGTTTVSSPGIVRDHTFRMLSGFGYPVRMTPDNVEITGGGTLIGTSIDIPADISSAAFFIVAATIAERSDLQLSHVGVNPTRTGVIDILRLMGANITVTNERLIGGEPVADIRVKSALLKGIEIPHELVPIAIDEFPVLFVAAALASGETVLTGAKELRVKESDRIQSMADGLQVLGVDARPLPDGIIIEGTTQLTGGTVDSYGDHRIAMAFAVAALKATSTIHILDCANVATSFPNFIRLAESIGMTISLLRKSVE
ncbi:MAG: bifunctional prephenate dehydrogenase/3-phosphoshikimate 1-carboxyvinyltransferase [Endozoicomonas sp. (ex Botrylloides leachii)]|nr:bifunctional prephenate dehydrogenase/3-phosphoshikimate 1-carboxyvinyltransferase [Endozoicomonas sp. (ex Botrylloides leachii)]